MEKVGQLVLAEAELADKLSAYEIFYVRRL
jgi:hypothetical protein